MNRPGPLRKQRAVAYMHLSQLRRRFRRPARDYLEARTERDGAWWVAFIQDAVAATFEDNPADPDHPICDPRLWAHALVDEIWRHRPQRYGDENMWMAQVLALAAGTWAVRIQRAKSMDPRRPVGLRRGAYQHWLELAHAFAAVVADESRDPEMFTQPWESPWVPDATDGKFV